MATFEAGVNHPLAAKLWSKKLFREGLKQCFMSKFIGSDSNSAVQLLTEAKKDKGDTIHVGLRMQLSGAGVVGHNTLEGNEEDLTTYRDSVLLDELVHAVRSNVRITQQRVPFDVREEMRMGLQDWWSDRIDTSLINQMCGFTTQSDTRYTGNNATVAASTTSGNTRLITAGEDSEASISDTAVNTFTLSLLDKAVSVAKTATPLIRPFRINGSEMYAAILHPYQVYQLRTSTNTGQWLDIQKAAMQGGKIADNPIFTGALGVYNNVVLHESTRIPNIVSTAGGGAAATVANCKRAVLFGSQSAAMAVGMNSSPEKMTWVEEYFDYERQLGVSAGMIFGAKKTVFNSIDFGTIVMSSYSPAP